MTIKTITTTPPGSSVQSCMHLVDATAGAEVIIVSEATDMPWEASVSIAKTDASANTVTLQTALGTVLVVLEAQNDAASFFCDRTAWSMLSNTSSTDAAAVAANLASHSSATEVHGSTGDVQGADDVAAALSAIEEILDPFGHVVAQFEPGSADAVNFWRFANAGTGGNVEVTAEGTDADIGAIFTAKGAGEFDFVGPLKENDNLVALSTATEVDEPEVSAEPTNPTVAEFDALVAIVADLRAAAIAARVAVAAP